MTKSKSTALSRGSRHGLGPAQIDAVAALFAVLSEPSRLCILQVLQQAPASVGELVKRTGFKQANVSKQLGILAAAGVIARRREGNLAIYSIVLPLVFDLCHLVCNGLATRARAQADALRR